MSEPEKGEETNHGGGWEGMAVKNAAMKGSGCSQSMVRYGAWMKLEWALH